MSSTLWPATPMAENATIEKEGPFIQKLSVPCSLIAGISIKLVHSAVIDLANDLTAQLSFKFISDLSV